MRTRAILALFAAAALMAVLNGAGASRALAQQEPAPAPSTPAVTAVEVSGCMSCHTKTDSASAHEIGDLRLGKKTEQLYADAEKLHKQLDHYAYGPPPVRFSDEDVDQARAAGVLIEFERGRPIIVDRALYRELVKTAIKRTHDELDAKAPKNSEFMPAAATFNVGTIVGGTAGNILARECDVLWGYRELPNQPLDALGKRAIEWLQKDLLPRMKARHQAATIATELRSSTPGFSPEGNDEAKALAGSWSGSNTAGSVVYATEAGIFRKVLGVPTVVCGPGDIAQAHQPNEYLLASQIDACEAFMRRMVEWACRD
jgi:acetylornithine deacetylase/succinyl-diaminopimelate desuccinylase-like protein